MKSTFLLRLTIICVSVLVVFSMITNTPANAASGLPNSPQFGYGARIDAWGQKVDVAINAATGIGLDWIGLDYDWTRQWPDKNQSPSLEPLNQAISLAGQNRLHVLLSITNPPAWAMQSDGPDASLTSELVSLLAQQFPNTLLAIELFPGANTTRGWGTAANPAAYIQVLKASQEVLRSLGSPIVIIAGGLTPLATEAAPGDMGDLVFLDNLYKNGAVNFMPILSIRMVETIDNPMTPPEGHDPRVLRHYESARSVMIKHGHQNGIIWITGFSWPAELLQPADQMAWFNQAYRLVKSQLYIGVAFFNQLNPPADSTTSSIPSLIQVDGQELRMHPAFTLFGQLITMDHTGKVPSNHNVLIKRITTDLFKQNLKTNQP
jgi:hypothetical protein